MTLFSEDQIQTSLSSLSGWKREDQQIKKTYKFPSFPKAMEFVNKLAEKAEEMQHHPDFLIAYDQVTLTLTTFDEGGLTKMDFDSARLADEVYPQYSS